MIEIPIPGFKDLEIKYLVLDYNGTIAFDGRLIDGLKERILALSEKIEIHVVTADTFGMAKKELKDLPVTLTIISEGDQDTKKMNYVWDLGPSFTACIGNGRNDQLMLQQSELGIVVIQDEGACTKLIVTADIACKDINSALDLFMNPTRLKATLRV